MRRCGSNATADKPVRGQSGGYRNHQPKGNDHVKVAPVWLPRYHENRNVERVVIRCDAGAPVIEHPAMSPKRIEAYPDVRGVGFELRKAVGDDNLHHVVDLIAPYPQQHTRDAQQRRQHGQGVERDAGESLHADIIPRIKEAPRRRLGLHRMTRPEPRRLRQMKNPPSKPGGRSLIFDHARETLNRAA
jgi:hypothetical protein